MSPWEVIGWAFAALVACNVGKAIVKDLMGRGR